MNSIVFGMHTIPVGKQHCDCLVETPCFLGFVLHNLSFVCLLNLVVLGLSLKNHHNILLCRGGFSQDEWKSQT